MLKFTIHLKSIDDFQKYVALLKNIHFVVIFRGGALAWTFMTFWNSLVIAR